MSPVVIEDQDLLLQMLSLFNAENARLREEIIRVKNEINTVESLISRGPKKKFNLEVERENVLGSPSRINLSLSSEIEPEFEDPAQDFNPTLGSALPSSSVAQSVVLAENEINHGSFYRHCQSLMSQMFSKKDFEPHTRAAPPIFAKYPGPIVWKGDQPSLAAIIETIGASSSVPFAESVVFLDAKDLAITSGPQASGLHAILPKHILEAQQWREVTFDEATPFSLFVTQRGNWHYLGDYISKQLFLLRDELWDQPEYRKVKEGFSSRLCHHDSWHGVRSDDVTLAKTMYARAGNKVACVGYLRVGWNDTFFHRISWENEAHHNVEATQSGGGRQKTSTKAGKKAPKPYDRATKQDSKPPAKKKSKKQPSNKK